MPTIRCTARLLRQLGESDTPTSAQTSPLDDWYAHIFTVERRKCLLFLNEKTLFTCLALGVRKAAYRDIRALLRKSLAGALSHEGYSQQEVDAIVGLHAELRLGRTQDRRVVGSLTNRVGDGAFLIEYYGGLDYCDPMYIAHLLNETPMKGIGYSNAQKQMRTFVTEHLICEE